MMNCSAFCIIYVGCEVSGVCSVIIYLLCIPSQLTFLWFLSLSVQFPSVNNQSHEIVESYEGTGISPYVHTQNSLSLTVGMSSAVSRIRAENVFKRLSQD